MTTILPIVLWGACSMAGPPAEGSDPSSVTAQESRSSSSGRLWPGHERKVAGEVGAAVGLAIPHGGFDVGPELMLEAGVRITLGVGSLGIHLRGGYQRFVVDGEGELPCVEGEDGPCIEGEGGTFDYEVVENVGRLALPVTYRFRSPTKRFVPYLQAAPTLFLMTARATSFDLINRQQSTKFGVAAALGAQVRLGPGGLFAELGYQWGGVDQRATGKGNVGAVLLALGYRFVL